MTSATNVLRRPTFFPKKPTVLPRLAPGVQLLGRYRDSGHHHPPGLVRRADGQVIQLSPLLYLVACHLDGEHYAGDVARLVTQRCGRSLHAGQVRYLISAKLTPLGLIAGERAAAVPPKAAPLLALRARSTLLSERAANAAALALSPLFWWPVVAAVITATVAMDYWLFSGHALATGLRQVLRNPTDLLIVVGLSVVSAAFHECGHAAACRYGGARPGVIGVGLYLIWPSFFTNVTDSYRLSRCGRLRTDLGGLYFNLIFMLAMVGVFGATRYTVLLLVVAITHLEMLQQLLPFVRFDGYFILSDLVGLPDMFARIVPVVASALSRSRRRDPRVTDLRRGARIAVTAWVLCVIPLLAALIGYMLAFLPAIDRALWHSVGDQALLMNAALESHRYPAVVADGIGAFLAALSITGTLFVVTGVTGQASTLSRHWCAGRPARWAAVASIAVLAVAVLAAWWVGLGQFRGW